MVGMTRTSGRASVQWSVSRHYVLSESTRRYPRRRARKLSVHGTRTARSYALAQIADTLHDLGFKGLRATWLKRKHVAALVKEWKRQGRSIGTVKNRMAHVRSWAKHVGRPGVVPVNAALGLANREYVTNEDKSVVLDPDKLALLAVRAPSAAPCATRAARRRLQDFALRMRQDSQDLAYSRLALRNAHGPCRSTPEA